MIDLFKFDLFLKCFPQLLSRLHVTLFIVIIAVFFGFILGAVIAISRLYKFPVISQISIFYVSFIRGVPILVLLFLVYIGLPILVKPFGLNINRWDTLIFVLIAYTLNSSAFLSEIIRSAVMGIDRGQSEAAYSIGMTRIQTFIRIICPQAIQIAIPSLGNTIISLLKDTSMAFTLGVIDVIGVIKSIGIRTDRSLEAYTAAAIIFFVMSFTLEQVFRIIGKKSTLNTLHSVYTPKRVREKAPSR